MLRELDVSPQNAVVLGRVAHQSFRFRVLSHVENSARTWPYHKFARIYLCTDVYDLKDKTALSGKTDQRWVGALEYRVLLHGVSWPKCFYIQPQGPMHPGSIQAVSAHQWGGSLVDEAI